VPSESLSVLEVRSEDAAAASATRRRRRALKAKTTRRRRRSSRRRKKSRAGTATAKAGGADSFKWPLGAPPKWADQLGARCGVDERKIQELERTFAECDTEIARIAFDSNNGKGTTQHMMQGTIMVLQFFAKFLGLNTRLLPSMSCCETLLKERNMRTEDDCLQGRAGQGPMSEDELPTKCVMPPGFYSLKWNKKAVEQCCGKCPSSKCDLNDKDGTCMKLEKFKDLGFGWDGWDTRCPARVEGDTSTRRLGDSHQLTEEFIFDTIKSVASKAMSFVKKKAGSLGKGAIAAAKKMAINLAAKLAPAKYRLIIQAAAPYLLKGDMKGMMKAVLKAVSGGHAKELIAYPMMRLFNKHSIGLDFECPIAEYMHPLVSSDFHIFIKWQNGPYPGSTHGCSNHYGFGPLKFKVVRLMLESHPDFAATKRKRPNDMNKEYSENCKDMKNGHDGQDCIEMCSFEYNADLHRCMPKAPDGGWPRGVEPKKNPRCDKAGMTFPRTTSSGYDHTKNKCSSSERDCESCKKWYLSMQALVQTLLSFGMSQTTNAINAKCFSSGERECDA
jgi:hypothetical protein